MGGDYCLPFGDLSVNQYHKTKKLLKYCNAIFFNFIILGQEEDKIPESQDNETASGEKLTEDIPETSSQDVLSQESSQVPSEETSQDGVSQDANSEEINSEKANQETTVDDDCVEKIENIDDEKKDQDEVGKPEFETAPNVSVDELQEDHTQVNI